ncbi:MAG: tRNA (guanosine(46)-N7)-methyltransferase TrmB [Bacilli bacterium]|nr:tRNA (guanosine(46)-N7)-methyltransferase TrmB [Bacilli bacterium]
MRTKYKPWALPYLKAHADFAYASFDPKNPFYKRNLWMEVGGGKGDFIIQMAKLNPKIHFVMIERVISVAGPALKKLNETDLKNVRIIYDNFINVIRDIPSRAVTKIFLNFSDPWPKKKHAKRRLTSPNFMLDYYRILKKHGQIVMKTDQDNLYEYTKLVLPKEKFKIIVDNPHYNRLDVNDALTEYEAKFRQEGKTIYRLIIEKI